MFKHWKTSSDLIWFDLIKTKLLKQINKLKVKKCYKVDNDNNNSMTNEQKFKQACLRLNSISVFLPKFRFSMKATKNWFEF